MASRRRQLAGSGRDPGADAEVPHVFGSLRGGLDWSRTFTLCRGQSTLVTADPVRERAALPGGEIFVPDRRREGGYFKTPVYRNASRCAWHQVSKVCAGFPANRSISLV